MISLTATAYAQKMTGQERAMLIRTIDEAVTVKAITPAEAGILRSIVNMDYGYPKLYKDYITGYKGKNGKGIEVFMQHIYDGTLPLQK
jgi:hypothetical protein